MKNKFFALLIFAAISFQACSLSKTTLWYAISVRYPENPSLDSIMQTVGTVMAAEPNSVTQCDSVASFLKKMLLMVDELPSPGAGVPEAKSNFYIYERWNSQRRDSLKRLD